MTSILRAEENIDGFDAKQVLISERVEEGLAVMWGVALERAWGTHSRGWLRGFGYGVFQGSHPTQKHGHERGGWMREAVKAEELLLCLLLLQESIGQARCSFWYPLPYFPSC